MTTAVDQHEIDIDTAFSDGRDHERADVQVYLQAEATSWERAERPDLAGVLRRLALDLADETHVSDTNWIPKSRPVVS